MDMILRFWVNSMTHDIATLECDDLGAVLTLLFLSPVLSFVLPMSTSNGSTNNLASSSSSEILNNHSLHDSNVTVVGLISDTHGVLDPPTITALKRATGTIIHAGDVGDQHRKSRLSAEQVIERLEKATGNTVIAVAGNVDEGVGDLPATQIVTVAGIKILTMHICGFPPNISQGSQELIDAAAPQVVVFGHSHVPGVQWQNDILFVNPGSAGPRRFKLPRCVAFLSFHTSGVVEVEFLPVATLPQDVAGLPLTLKQSIETPATCLQCLAPINPVKCENENRIFKKQRRVDTPFNN